MAESSTPPSTDDKKPPPPPPPPPPFGVWWPAGDSGKLREAATAWKTIADHLDTTTHTLSAAVGAVTQANSGAAIDAFAAHWQLTGGSRGALPTVAGYCRNMATALAAFAHAIDKARDQIIKLAAEIAASIVIGTALAIFTAGISEAAAGVTTAGIIASAEALGVTLTEEAAAIIGSVLTMGTMVSIESMATDAIVQLGGNLAFNANHNPLDGFNLGEVESAGEFGLLAGGMAGGMQALREASLAMRAWDVSGDAAATEGSGGDLDTVAQHLERLDHSPANDAMISRIRQALEEGKPLTEGERNFMMHETTEAQLMDQGMPYEEAHEIALRTHPLFKNYDPEVIDQFPELFNNNWRRAWGMEPR